MKKIIIIAAAILLSVACKKDVGSNTPDQSGLALKKYADIASNALLSNTNKGTTSPQIIGEQVTRPLKSSGSGTISYVPNGCGDGTLQLKSVGTGNSTALGSFTQSTNVCIDLSNGQIIGSVVGVGTAANGDELSYTFVGAGIDPATGFMYQDYIITGGTGRFTNASGSMTLLYQVNTPTNFSYTGEGTITY